MTERKKPGVAKQKIEAERRDRGDQTVGQELNLIEAGNERDQSQDDQGRCCGN
jgi:hypothetical protein